MALSSAQRATAEVHALLGRRGRGLKWCRTCGAKHRGNCDLVPVYTATQPQRWARRDLAERLDDIEWETF